MRQSDVGSASERGESGCDVGSDRRVERDRRAGESGKMKINGGRRKLR